MLENKANILGSLSRVNTPDALPALVSEDKIKPRSYFQRALKIYYLCRTGGEIRSVLLKVKRNNTVYAL